MGSEALGARLEGLLASYARSTGSAEGGVPAELIQGATRISAAHASLSKRGPGDAVASDDRDYEDDAAPIADNTSAVVMEGGGESLEPPRIWVNLTWSGQAMRMRRRGSHTRI